MPELPDITVYCERLQDLAGGEVLRQLRIQNPFVLRTAVPPITAAEGCTLAGVQRLGKRVVLVLQPPPSAPGAPPPGPLYLVIHLMIAGRLHWQLPGGKAPQPARGVLASFAFGADTGRAIGVGTLVLTEAGTQRRASIHLLPDAAALQAMDPGGLEPLADDATAFAQRLRSENHTLKRALTDPALFSGIGNAYSDEILHRARLSPLALSRSLDDAAMARLHAATVAVLTEWTGRLRAEALSNAKGAGWPVKVTAFRPEMAVHGRFNQPCPDCGSPVQRIVHADNETNYCARCQTGGRLLADRALSRLLKDGRPKHLDDLA